MMHRFPDLVGDDTPAEYLNDPYEHGMVDLISAGPLTSYRPFDEYSKSGAIDDPSLASAEKGRQLYEYLQAELAVVLERIHEQAQS